MTGKRIEVKVSTFDVADYLHDDDAEAFLALCLDQSPPDGRLIASALGAIARARGMMSKVAEVTGLSRESLYKALSGSRDPGFTTVLKVLTALGYSLSVAREKAIGEPARASVTLQEFFPFQVGQEYLAIAPSSGATTLDARFDEPLDVLVPNWITLRSGKGYLTASASTANSPSLPTPRASGNVSTLSVRTFQ